MSDRTKRFELVEITVDPNLGAGSRSAFDTIPQLRDQANQQIIVMDIAVYLDTTYAFSQVTNTIPGMVAADLPRGALTLYVNGEESIKTIPLVELVHSNDVTNPFQQNWYPFDSLRNVDWDKSYIQWNSAPTATTFVVPFGIRYIRLMKNAQGLWVENPNER